MTRLWGVDVEKLCRQHLLGEHKEMHQIAGTINNHPHGLAIAKGHAEQGDIDSSLIAERHDKLAEEMLKRGYNHDSPLEYTDELDIGEIDREYNREDLRDRCDDCTV